MERCFFSEFLWRQPKLQGNPCHVMNVVEVNLVLNSTCVLTCGLTRKEPLWGRWWTLGVFSVSPGLSENLFLPPGSGCVGWSLGKDPDGEQEQALDRVDPGNTFFIRLRMLFTWMLSVLRRHFQPPVFTAWAPLSLLPSLHRERFSPFLLGQGTGLHFLRLSSRRRGSLHFKGFLYSKEKNVSF